MQVLRVEAGEGRYPLGRLGVGHYHPFVYHVVGDALLFAPVLNRYLPPDMLNRGNVRVSPDGVGPRHVPYSIEGAWEGSPQGNYVLDHSGGSKGNHLSQLWLEGWFRFGGRDTGNMCFKGWYGM